MAEMVEISPEALLAVLGAAGTVSIEPYGFDKRCGWDTHAVMLDGRIVGFTDEGGRHVHD